MAAPYTTSWPSGRGRMPPRLTTHSCSSTWQDKALFRMIIWRTLSNQLVGGIRNQQLRCLPSRGKDWAANRGSAGYASFLARRQQHRRHRARTALQ